MPDDFYDRWAAEVGKPVHVEPFTPADLASQAADRASGRSRAIAAPDDPGAGFATSLATVAVTVPFTHEVVRIDGLTAFSYSSDVRQVGDPFSVTVPDPRGKLVGKLVRGARCVLSLSNASVAGGIKVRKTTGRIIRRRVTCNAQGTIITLLGADLGWHLANEDGPLWFGLQGCTWDRLLEACIHPDRVFRTKSGQPVPDPGWGFADEVRFEGTLNARLKQGKQGVILANQANPLIPLGRIQIEPGEKLFDVLSLYAKRIGCLVNVSADGQLQVFAPDYAQEPSYHFYCYPTTDPRHTKNNVEAQGISLEEGIEEVWTDVTCVGDVPLPDLIDEQVAQDNVNATKFRGRYVPDPPPLEFMHRLVFTDGEVLSGRTPQASPTRPGVFADERAIWKTNMGLYDGHVLSFTVRDHHQGALFFEANTMCHIDFPVVGIGPASYYVSAVRCDRGDNGDTTTVTAHLPGLMGV